MALIKVYRKKNIKLPPVAKDAKSLYMENKTVQFVFDRHMSNSQIATGDLESNRVLSL
ncbi:7938_t:CDS:2 [Funneliformis geosporum]|uniref:7938_t:CDS:1 n=1 Tax=Funneliformis geosporum TaxID=1117311 RepID=A0A9W4WKS9_9GLOM|nr:7938_t:CDS:2 [Funneliformis geosporum]